MQSLYLECICRCNLPYSALPARSASLRGLLTDAATYYPGAPGAHKTAALWRGRHPDQGPSMTPPPRSSCAPPERPPDAGPGQRLVRHGFPQGSVPMDCATSHHPPRRAQQQCCTSDRDDADRQVKNLCAAGIAIACLPGRLRVTRGDPYQT
jgi:hypothetical protein